MYQSGMTIKDALNSLSKNLYVLPAIQREFVWKPEQICRLFDSLMQGYPFVIDLRGPEQFRNLAALLKARGHSAARIERYLGSISCGLPRMCGATERGL